MICLRQTSDLRIRTFNYAVKLNSGMKSRNPRKAALASLVTWVQLNNKINPVLGISKYYPTKFMLKCCIFPLSFARV